MPETLNADELLKESFARKMKGRRQASEGKTVSTEEAKEKPGRWLK